MLQGVGGGWGRDRRPVAPKDRRQIAEFRKAARELGYEDNEEAFQRALRTLAKSKKKTNHRKEKM